MCRGHLLLTALSTLSQEGFLNFTPVGSHITFITSEPLPKHLPHRCAGRSFTYLTAAQPTGAKVGGRVAQGRAEN